MHLVFCHSFECATANIDSPVLSTRSNASKALKLTVQPEFGCSIFTKLSPNIISGTAIPSFSVISSIGAALRIGSLRVLIVKPWTENFWTFSGLGNVSRTADPLLAMRAESPHKAASRCEFSYDLKSSWTRTG
jgi:hypothetical protein